MISMKKYAGWAVIAGTLGCSVWAGAAEVKTKGGLSVASDDGQFSFKFGGRLMLDAAYFDDDHTNMGDGTEMRRARFFAAGKLFGDWEYKAQYDFADGTDIKDAYIAYTALPSSKIIVGNFKQPFSLEELTSSKYITFMERALPNIFAPSRRVGLGWKMNTEQATFFASAYGQDVNKDAEGDEGYGVGARATFAPINEKNRVIHFGAAGAWETGNENEDEVESFRYRQRPESHLAERLLDTGTLTGADGSVKLGVEGAAVFGPFSLQAEYLATTIFEDENEGNMTDDTDLSGYYVYGSWFITGESRVYKNGIFGRVKPKSPAGAWEVAARYSALEFDDGAVSEGELSNITLGVNYYVNPNLRFMLNYVMAEAEYADGTKDEPDIIQMRAQIDF